jgi:ribonucleoside-diphosphate reductase alpha chain
MGTALRLPNDAVNDIPFQEASTDIWEKKYRLVAKDGTVLDKTLDDTYRRIARAIADVEEGDKRGYWYERFLWALRKGAIPAGRIVSNAGALAHKPATSTITARCRAQCSIPWTTSSRRCTRPASR